MARTRPGGCGGGAEAGALGTVEIKSGQPIEIRGILFDSIKPSISRVLQTAIETAVDDLGQIEGYRVSFESLDEKCSPAGGRAAGEAVVAEAQVVGIIGTLRSATAVETSPSLSAAGASMISPFNMSPMLTSELAGNKGPDHHESYCGVRAGEVVLSVPDRRSVRTLVNASPVHAEANDGSTRPCPPCPWHRNTRSRSGSSGPTGDNALSCLSGGAQGLDLRSECRLVRCSI